MIGGVFVRLFNECCFAIVGADVAHNFAIEIFDRAEDAAGNEASLDGRIAAGARERRDLPRTRRILRWYAGR